MNEIGSHPILSTSKPTNINMKEGQLPNQGGSQVGPDVIKQQVEGPSQPAKGAPTASILSPSIPETLTQNADEGKKGKKAKDPLDITGNISIRPYVEGGMENMGLEDYGFAVAPEVENIKDPEQKAAIILGIRTIVAKLEKQLASNMLKVDDDEFWNKVKLLKPDNLEFWSQISIRCNNDPVWLKPKEDPYDLIKFMAIEAGGFDIVAKSFEDAQAKAKPPKFYLDKEIDTVSTRTEYKKLRNKAISELDAIFNKNPKKLLYVTKSLETYSAQYKNSTPPDILYDAMDEYIAGNGVETNKARAAENFSKAVDLDMETLKLKSLVKDASFYKFISLKPDGMIYHTASGGMLGRNVSDVVEFFKSPLNEDVLTKVLAEVEAYWNA
jgi:hypothetical protein